MSGSSRGAGVAASHPAEVRPVVADRKKRARVLHLDAETGAFVAQKRDRPHSRSRLPRGCVASSRGARVGVEPLSGRDCWPRGQPQAAAYSRSGRRERVSPPLDGLPSAGGGRLGRRRWGARARSGRGRRVGLRPARCSAPRDLWADRTTPREGAAPRSYPSPPGRAGRSLALKGCMRSSFMGTASSIARRAVAR